MAKITEYTFASKDDRRTAIHGVKWLPEEKEVTAVLQIVHGMQEHIERYDEFARYMTDRGFAVFGHDHIGHGDSVADPGDLGIMHCSRPDDVMVRDMYTNYRIIRKEYPDKPYFILGHSMGSYLLRKFLCVGSSRLKNVSGAVIMGTGTESDIALLTGRMLCRLLCIIKGRDSKSPFIKGIMFSSKYYRKFDTTGEHPENSWLSKNAENVRKFADPENPKDGCEFSLNGYMILLRSIFFDNRMSNIRKMNMDIPVLFVSGDQDPVGAMGKGVKRAYAKFAAAGVKDLSIRLYEGDRHEILNELDRDKVFEELYYWMKQRM